MNINISKIKEFKINNDNLLIYCDNCILYIDIINGSYNIIIEDTEKDILGINNLNINDIIIIKYKKKNKDFIFPYKIIINTKYKLLDELSDDEPEK
jgi:hypothetical protein